MINSISELITQRWVKRNIIPQEDYELYHYGWFVVLTDLWLFSFTLIIGIAFRLILPSIIFFVTFFIIRRFAGGYHAKTELQCQIISLSFLFLSIIAMKYLLFGLDGKYLIIIDLICVIILPLISPADTPQKPLSDSEKKSFKKMIAFIGAVLFAAVCIILYFEIKTVAVPIICAFVLETVLVVFGRLLNHRLDGI